MAPPPRYLITRKLVNQYFKKYIPTQPQGLKDENEMFDCWRKYGFDNPVCKEFEIQMFDAETIRSKYKGKVDALRIKENVMNKLKRPDYPERHKGQFHEKWHTRPWTLLDGLKP